MTNESRRPVRIANCSGFYGDRLAAAAEMVEGGPIDVLTGDYLAELTMLILWKARQKDADGGYAKTFLVQMEAVLGTCLERGIRIVSNAGGLNPAGLAGQIKALGRRLGLAPNVAYVVGDDLIERIDDLMASGIDFSNMDTGTPFAVANRETISANAYLGGWGITEALAAGADIVVCPRVTDASLVVGPAAWWHGWSRDDLDQVAGAIVAGHAIECGPQVTGGNYPFLDEIDEHRYPGFPIAEVASDGSSVITKHPGTGGLVSIGTVTAQLLYEIGSPAYVNPDAVAHFDSLSLSQESPDRVRISATSGSPPPAKLKVAMNQIGGYRNTMTLVVTGLDIEAKANYARQLLFEILGGEDTFDEIDVRLIRFDHVDSRMNAESVAHLCVTVKDSDPIKVGRKFSNATMELALASYAGFHTTSPPTPASAYGIYRPTLVPTAVVDHVVVLPDGSSRSIPHTTPDAIVRGEFHSAVRSAPIRPSDPLSHPIMTVPLGRICGARSGDKGGNANVGLWTRNTANYPWLADYLTVERFRLLLPEAEGQAVLRYDFPNLGALNFVIVGLLGDGVASTTRPDPQAKGLGEYIRSRLVDVPASLVERSV
jgi:hypothetical protein